MSQSLNEHSVQGLPPDPTKPLLSGPTILLLAALVHGFMLISLPLGWLNPLFDDSTHRTGRGADFFAVYQAGSNLLDGVSIYSTTPRIQRVPYYYPYRYHPLVAATVGLGAQLIAPFSAYGLWIIVLEGLLLFNVFLTWRLFQNKFHAAVGVALWLVFSPYYLELFMGQFSFLMGSLIFWTLLAWNRSARLQGDFLWTLSLAIKSNSVLFAPVLLREGRWKTVLIGGVITLVLASPYFIAKPDTYEEFARNYSEPLSMPALLGNQGFSGLLGIAILRTSGLWTDNIELLGERVPEMDELMETPLSIWTLMVIGGTLLITFKSGKPNGPGLYLLWLLAFFLFYKHVWEHHYVMLMPVFVLLYYGITSGSLPMSKILFWIVFASLALPTAFVLIDKSPVLFDPELSWEPWKSFLYHIPKPLAVLVLYGDLGRTLLRTPEKESRLSV